MNPSAFIAKWKKTTLTEQSSAQQHFLDLCEMLDHPTPATADATGDEFTFEKGARKLGGGDGWADVWMKGSFAWEYKGKHKDLDAAYRQLLQYRESLENPPLLVVSDINRIIIHTNFTNTPHRAYEIPLAELATKTNQGILRALFYDPEALKPGTERKVITTQAASKIAQIAQALRNRGLDAHEVAHFLDRIVFCLFAEDTGLLPAGMFGKISEKGKIDPARFSRLTGELFRVMANGGDFGVETIRHFNGNLFDGGPALDLTTDEIEQIWQASRLDWGAVDPSIFGTLFERGLDPDKRSQLGAHYTSREDIETLVEPVVMQPLKREWEVVRDRVDALLDKGDKKNVSKAEGLLSAFVERLSKVKVLDPACGSGNFLYVTLQKLKDLEKQVIEYGQSRNLSGPMQLVGPWQLHGIEINTYACDLAQMTVWIGYLQWQRDNGYLNFDDPVLRSMDNFQCKDAILDLTDPDNPREPDWPSVDYIVGNPPFLGDKLMRGILGDDYTEMLRAMYAGRIPGQSDLCCYWFEKARAHILARKCRRAGLLATNSIRQAGNRRVLERLVESGGIFFAVNDRPWVLDGASVRVALVAFDGGDETIYYLDGQAVSSINAVLENAIDFSVASQLPENKGVAFIGDCKKGSFDIPEVMAIEWLRDVNPNGRPNSDVLVPLVNAADVTGRERNMWVIDFGVATPQSNASLYEQPFEYVLAHVKPARDQVRNPLERTRWWLHARPAPDMRDAVASVDAAIVTPGVSKHRIFARLRRPYQPAHRLIVFGRSDDAFAGVLQSKPHQVWALRLGSTLEDRPCYTPTTCFETFPFPEPSEEQREAIALAAKELDELRNNWLNPREWTKEAVLEFPGSVDGPWARYVVEPDERGIGTVRYPRIVAGDDASAVQLKKRTLTNLYNQRPTWLDLAHKKLDEAVFAAYGWDPSMTDEQILESLLRLNLERAGR